MKVGLVCPYSWDVPGGVKSHINDLALALMARGHEVSVLAPSDEDADLPSFVVPAGRAVPVRYNGSVARITFGPLSVRRVRRWIEEQELDVLHVHEPASPSLSVIACWAALGPMVGTFHTSNERSRVMSTAANILQTALEKLSARIAVSEAARRTLIDHLGGDAVVIPNGVNVSAYSQAPRMEGWPGSGGSVGFLGRLDEARKGFAVLAQAMPAIVAAHPGVRFLIAGPGDAEDAMEDVPDSIRSHVTFLGRVSDADKASALRSVDVFVAPNTGGESFGIVLLEAMAAGAPVVASDIDAFSRVLQGGAAGDMFTNGDASALAKSVNALLADPARRDALAVAGSAAVARYDWSIVVSDIVAVYEMVTESGEKVREDVRGTALGRITKLGRGAGR